MQYLLGIYIYGKSLVIATLKRLCISRIFDRNVVSCDEVILNDFVILSITRQQMQSSEIGLQLLTPDGKPFLNTYATVASFHTLGNLSAAK
jgi:hypothetical protein